MSGKWSQVGVPHKGWSSVSLDAGPMLEFEVVFLENLPPFPELLPAPKAETCVSRGLHRTGFVAVEKKTGSPIILHHAFVARGALL